MNELEKYCFRLMSKSYDRDQIIRLSQIRFDDVKIDAVKEILNKYQYGKNKKGELSWVHTMKPG